MDNPTRPHTSDVGTQFLQLVAHGLQDRQFRRRFGQSVPQILQ